MLSRKAFPYRMNNWCLPIVIVILLASSLLADKPGWKTEQVDWRLTGGAKIKEIRYPEGKPVPTLEKQRLRARRVHRKKPLPPEAALRLANRFPGGQPAMFATVIDSPPVNGFVPWVAVAITNRRIPEMDMIFDAVPETFVTGSYLSANPQSDFAVGIFDSGAGAHVINGAAAFQAGLKGQYLTSNTVKITGVTGSVDATVSQPIGIFIDGIGAVEPNGKLYDTSSMVGEWNTAVAVGNQIASPNMPTAIGSPLSVFYAADIRNDRQTTITHNNEDFNGPDMFLYDVYEPCTPSYPNFVPLELRPLGAVSVQYVPTLDLYTFEFVPASPSVIIGISSQSLFFVGSVDLYEGNKSAIDKSRFMLDTGAQLTVIGSRIAARLAINPANAEFEVPVTGVTGDTIMVPGFFIDTIEIPAIGEWLSFTNVPVILLDIASPEGGTLDGIIGMNLFVEHNIILRGGGFMTEPDPKLEFAPIPYRIPGDITPRQGDDTVNYLDLRLLANAWLATKNPRSPNWNPICDLAPQPNPDGIINALDFAVLAGHWLETVP